MEIVSCFPGKNTDTQEQLRNALESLKQHQETITALKVRISEESSRNLHAEETQGETEHEFHRKVKGADFLSFLLFLFKLTL